MTQMSQSLSITDQKRRQTDPLSRRLLSTFRLNNNILQKFHSKGLTLKSEIEFLTDSDLQEMCGMTEDQLETIDRAVRKTHLTPIRWESGLELKNTAPQFVHTGCDSLDRSINGGVEVGKITQLVAAGGCGKTQICMQCCVNIQLPPENGGLSAAALYIDTEKNFRPERVLEMAEHKIKEIETLKGSLTPAMMSDKIHTLRCESPKDLVNVLVDKVEIFIDQHPDIKLVIVDSIAHLFRYDYEGSASEKDSQLSQIAIKLREIAHYKKVAVLVTNQMRYNQMSQKDEAALGKQWQNYCNLSVVFKKFQTGQRMGHLIRTREVERPSNFIFEIKEFGIKDFVPGKGWRTNL